MGSDDEGSDTKALEPNAASDSVAASGEVSDGVTKSTETSTKGGKGDKKDTKKGTSGDAVPSSETKTKVKPDSPKNDDVNKPSGNSSAKNGKTGKNVKNGKNAKTSPKDANGEDSQNVEESKTSGEGKSNAENGTKKNSRANKRGSDSQNPPRKRPKTTVVKKSVPPSGAYAKLEGKNTKTKEAIVEFITQLPATLGKSPESSDTSREDFIGLGQGAGLEEEHAVIDYDPKKREFTLKVCGESGVLVNGNRYEGSKKEVVVLQNKDPVRIADACFYFLLPTSTKPIKPTLTYAELAEEAFRRVGPGVPMSTREIAEVLRTTYAYYQDAPGLTGSLQQAVRRSKAFAKVGMMKSEKNSNQRQAFLLASDESDLAKELKEPMEDGSDRPISCEPAEKRIAELQGTPPTKSATAQAPAS